ncbi:hypothetical protein NE235_25065 [Actinoallomurus spadix]|uniref:DUF4274 domain-containing protein n=1 Tax=Actinoallomurus spadix TaxID=79912 RepID=A0ABN0WGE2_9ACTN|nr:hypothetical protein [Actinoallomurus spadix]MCO5989382.1 hypothetical protein [Actinoallomurus spadix]
MSDKDDNVTRLPTSEVEGYDDLLEFDADEFLREWQEADRAAVEILREALPEVVATAVPAEQLRRAAEGIRRGLKDWPHRHLATAAGWRGGPPADDEILWTQAAGALIAMNGESGLGTHEESALMTLQHADWAGAVIGLARAGVGARAHPSDLFSYADRCPEIEGSYDPDDREPVEQGFELIVPVWEAVGALDEHRRLTPLGHWGLPRALAWAWDGSLDEG